MIAELVLSEAEQAELKRLSSRRKTAQALALRARIVLECAQGLENQVVAAGLGVAKNTVGKWRRRFVERRMDGLHDEPRSTAALDRGCRYRGGHCEDVGKSARECHALELARHGQGVRNLGLLRASGGRLACSRIESRHSSFRPIRTSSPKCAMSSAFTWRPPSMRSCSASTRRDPMGSG